MRILVTGGAGYVGSHVVRALLDGGHEAVVYDNLSIGHAEAVGEAELVVADLANRDILTKLLQSRRFDGCVHLAASCLVGESVQNPAAYFANNVANGLNLCNALVASEVPWVVISSTCAVYGEPEAVPMTEDHPRQPVNPYGESKLMMERILHWYDRAYGLRHVSLRYFNAAGAHPDGRIGEDHTPETHLIPNILLAALGRKEAVEIFGADYPTPDGTAVRDYVHVCDLASAHFRAIQALARSGQSASYNLGTGRGYSVLEVIESARLVTGVDFPVKIGPRRPGDPPALVAGADRANWELGWRPLYPGLEPIIDTAWNWRRRNPGGYST